MGGASSRQPERPAPSALEFRVSRIYTWLQHTRRASAARHAISRWVFSCSRAAGLKFVKPPLSFEAQADLLIARGMGGDRTEMIRRLAEVNYYRLSGYWYPYRTSDDTFRPGTRFDAIWGRYVFDSRLRLLVMDAIGNIEIAMRAQIAYHHAHAFGPFGYATDSGSLPNLRDRVPFLARIREEVERSREAFVAHFKTKYGGHHDALPLWMATEVMSFGSALTLYRGCPRNVTEAVADTFSVPNRVLSSWLLCLNAVRNICAHHGRLWNRVLGVKPKIPRQHRHPDWHLPMTIPNDRIFCVLTICKYCLDKVKVQGYWEERLRALLDDSPKIPRRSMGFLSAWDRSPLWQKAECAR